MTIVLILILLTLWLIVCALCTAVGFYLGQKYKPKQEPRAVLPTEPTAEEKRKAIRRKKELENMISYDGSEQPDIVV